MKIKDILPTIASDHDAEIQFKSVQSDSRRVKLGDLFVAIDCPQIMEHLRTAVDNGAVAIVLDQEIFQSSGELLPRSTYVPVPHARAFLARAAAYLYPNQPKNILAVTGTNGKSSTVTFVRQLLGLLGRKAASFGTVGLEVTQDPKILDLISTPKLTTPDAMSMHCMLDQLVLHGVNDFAFEASSHGLDQYRLHEVGVTAAAFTNLTQDHLDYHGTMENYFQSKARLFTEVLLEGGTAVVNAVSDYSKSLMLLLKQRDINLITYGVECEADLVARDVTLHPGKISFDVFWQGRSLGMAEIFIAGNFQVENVLAAMGLVMSAGVPVEKLIPLLPQLKSARGRMELAGAKSIPAGDAAVYVDYAHTPDALERALKALRSHLLENGRLCVVFGCGGNRDASKRALMGEVAQELADEVFVTDDNPRHEEPSFIRAQILAHCPKGQEIPDRHGAIEQSITQLHANDILLIAGKGHETGQLIKDDIIPFDDIQVVQSILQRLTPANRTVGESSRL